MGKGGIRHAPVISESRGESLRTCEEFFFSGHAFLCSLDGEVIREVTWLSPARETGVTEEVATLFAYRVGERRLLLEFACGSENAWLFVRCASVRDTVVDLLSLWSRDEGCCRLYVCPGLEPDVGACMGGV